MFGIADTDIFAFTNAYVYKITNEIFSYFPLKQLFDNKYILLPYPMYKAWTSNSHIHEEKPRLRLWKKGVQWYLAKINNIALGYIFVLYQREQVLRKWKKTVKYNVSRVLEQDI